MGRDRVAYELPGLDKARGKGETPRETLGHGKLRGVQEPGPMRGVREEPMPAIVRGREDFCCTPERPKDGWEHRVALQYAGVFPPRLRNYELLGLGVAFRLGVREVERAAAGGRGLKTCADSAVARRGGGVPENRACSGPVAKCKYVVVPGGRKDTPGSDLPQVIRGLFLLGSEAIAHVPEIFTDRFQPLGVFEEWPHTLQDHEAGPRHPRQLDEVEDDLAPCIPIALALPHLTKGLAGEARRDEVDPRMLCSLGLELDGVAPCGGGSSMGMRRVVRLRGFLVNVTSPDGGRT